MRGVIGRMSRVSVENLGTYFIGKDDVFLSLVILTSAIAVGGTVRQIPGLLRFRRTVKAANAGCVLVCCIVFFTIVGSLVRLSPDSG